MIGAWTVFQLHKATRPDGLHRLKENTLGGRKPHPCKGWLRAERQMLLPPGRNHPCAPRSDCVQSSAYCRHLSDPNTPKLP